MASSAADLSSSELRSALAFAADLADCRDPIELDRQVRRLPQIVGADTIIIGAVQKPPRGSREPATLVASDDPPGFFDQAAREAFGRLWDQQPLVVHHFRGFAPRAAKVSDFLSERQWRRSEVYNDCYGKLLGLAWEMAAQIRCTPDEVACAALQRSDYDFSERDRAYLDAIAPHMRAAYARIDILELRRRQVELLERGLESSGVGLLLVGRGGQIVAAGPRARTVLHDWFGERSEGQSLSTEIEAWRVSERGSPSPATFELRRGSRRLRLRLVAGEHDDAILIAELGADGPDAETLRRRLPISPREAEVLALLARGRMNAAIAQELDISPHTVNRHVEHLYTKLGVHNRADATAAALAALTPDPPATQ